LEKIGRLFVPVFSQFSSRYYDLRALVKKIGMFAPVFLSYPQKIDSLLLLLIFFIKEANSRRVIKNCG